MFPGLYYRTDGRSKRDLACTSFPIDLLEIPFFHLLKIPILAEFLARMISLPPSVLSLLSFLPWCSCSISRFLDVDADDDDDDARVRVADDVASRDATPRLFHRVSGASVDVRDARYFKFHPGYTGRSPPVDSLSSVLLLPLLSPLSLSLFSLISVQSFFFAMFYFLFDVVIYFQKFFNIFNVECTISIFDRTQFQFWKGCHYSDNVANSTWFQINCLS